MKYHDFAQSKTAARNPCNVSMPRPNIDTTAIIRTSQSESFSGAASSNINVSPPGPQPPLSFEGRDCQ